MEENSDEQPKINGIHIFINSFAYGDNKLEVIYICLILKKSYGVGIRDEIRTFLFSTRRYFKNFEFF